MLEITRGCPRNCSFCTAIRVSGQKMRLRPVDEVVDKIERRGIRRFFLTDNNFGLAFRTNPDYIEALFKALAPLPLQGWTAQAEMLASTKSKIIGVTGPVEVGDAKTYIDGFVQGVASVDPGHHCVQNLDRFIL